jgi:hypothetical protein
MSTRQFLALLRAADRHAALLRAIARSPAVLLQPRQDLGRGVPAVHIRCGACGTPAATVERHGGALRVRIGRRVRQVALAGAVQCPEHGPLRVTWEALEPYLARTRPATYRASPRSMP